MTREEIVQLIIEARDIGPDSAYREWIRNHPCCVCGAAFRKCQAAHVRRAAESGIGCKAEYACVPLCHDCHHIQHQNGETAVLRKAGMLLPPLIAKEKFDSFRQKYLKLWVEK